ncbi:MAG: hypothetical protein FWC30_05865 [Candidatus Bathyarchaeota archaeon]|nr:hypothetical protein [Candidatus Termiticorpusculum sp.]
MVLLPQNYNRGTNFDVTNMCQVVKKRFIAVKVFMLYLCITIKVTIMAKPIPLPDITDEAAKELERDIKRGPTKLQKEIMEQNRVIFNKSVKKRTN